MPLDLAQQALAEARVPGLSINSCTGDRWLVEEVDDPGGPDVAGTIEVPPGLAALASTPAHLEMTRVDVDKARSLGRLADSLGVAAAAVAAIGDGRNDLGMLGSPGWRSPPPTRTPTS